MLGSIVTGEAFAAAPRRSSRSSTSIRPGCELGLGLRRDQHYDHPNRLGVDRWVALIGARHRLLARGTRPALVVMVGTAVTIEPSIAAAASSVA
jgi:pantothenate kinase type III